MIGFKKSLNKLNCNNKEINQKYNNNNKGKK